jgi:prepilin-type N-terminal cleavage/methylation domain-containing protein
MKATGIQPISPHPPANPRGRAGVCLAQMRPRGRAGFTLVEMLVVIVIVGLILGILLPIVSRVRASAKSVNCVSNLRQIAVAFHQYAQDNADRLPDPTGDDISWETALARYVGNKGLYVCPADGELAASVGSSYDWRDTGNPATTLAGQPISEIQSSNAVLVFDAMPNWHARGKMNAAKLDGSVVSMDDQECLSDLTRHLRAIQWGGRKEQF